VLIDAVFTIIVLAAATGPALRWLLKNKPSANTGSGFDSAGVVLLWTLTALLLASYYSYSRGYKVRQACSSFQKAVAASQLSEKQFERIAEEKWWSICHSDTATSSD
jgi:hypothetical protein